MARRVKFAIFLCWDFTESVAKIEHDTGRMGRLSSVCHRLNKASKMDRVSYLPVAA